MKSLSKLTSSILLLVLMLSVFPTVGVTTAHAATCSNWAQFIADVTVPDRTPYTPGTTFTKTWRLRNIGTCTWNTSYALVYFSGNQMGAPAAVNFPNNVAPGQIVDLSVNMTAPNTPGLIFSYWKLRNDSGVIFGIGYSANSAFWAEINVNAAPGVAYDFVANATSAAWSSGAGALTFPGTDGDASGFGLKLDNPHFESNVVLGSPGLLVAPQNIYNGYVQAVYPAFRVQSGDRFRAMIGCEYDATSCYVAYRLDYQIGSGPVRTFWTFRERYEGLTYNVNLNLSSLAGYDVKFILVNSAYGSATGDRALWGDPIISRFGAPVVTATPTVTGTPPTPTPTSTAPTPTSTLPPSTCDKVQFIADVTVPDGTTYAPGTPFAKTWELKNIGACPWTTAYQLVFYSGDPMSGPSSLNFPQQVNPNQSVKLTVNLVAPTTAGTYRGYWMFKNASGQLFGYGAPQYNKAWWVEIKVSGSSPGPTYTPTVTPTVTATPTATTTASPLSDWNTYQNVTYGFLFKFPPGSIFSNQAVDTNARIYLPLVEAGTNLGEKYLEVNVTENATECKSPNPGQSTSENVTINSIPFLKETGQDAAAGNRYNWFSYSTTKDTTCINLSFVLHSTVPENYPTPPPEYDMAAESAVFDTIMSTFGWISQ